MNLDLSKFKRVTQTAPPDQFELDAVRRNNQLNDWQDSEPDDSGFAFMHDPKSDENELYEMIHNYDYDHDDPKSSPNGDLVDGLPRFLHDLGWRVTKRKVQLNKFASLPRPFGRE